MASLRRRDKTPTRPWTVRWRQGGSQRRRSFRTRREAAEWQGQAQQIEDDERHGRGTAPAYVLKRTLREQWSEWTKTRAHLSSATRAKDQWVWRKWLKPYLADRKVGTLGHRDLSEVLTKITESGSGADARIAVYTRFNMLLDDAVGKGQHTGRQAVAGTSRRQRDINPLTDEELSRLLEAVPNQHRLLVDTIATLGLRPHEALMLRGQDVQRGVAHVRTRKGGKEASRVLPLPQRLKASLQARANEVGRQGKLFPIPDWRNWTKRVWRPAVEQAGLDAAPYDLRHTAASKLIAAGATPTDVAEWLGHSVQMTLATYSHLFPGRKEELAVLLNR